MSAILSAAGIAVAEGEIVALLGANGAGKTEWIETVLGFRPGAVSLLGRDVSALEVERRVALGIGYVPLYACALVLIGLILAMRVSAYIVLRNRP